MKSINRILLIVAVLGFAACEDFTELNILDNPNAVSPQKASVNDLYNNIVLTFENIYAATVGFGQDLTRMEAATGGYTYDTMYGPGTFTGLWTNTYANLFTDVDALVALAGEKGLKIHIGTAKIMKAYAMMILVDLFGDVPYTEALQGTDNPSPIADSGESIYAAAVALLDEAIGDLTGTNAAKPSGDLFYAGNTARWITLANTLKLRAYITTRLVDGSAASKINSLISEGNLIDQASEDFAFQFSQQRDAPNSRHPWYNNHYETTDGAYMSNWYMWLMYRDKEDVVDPRMRFYFYRQVGTVENRSSTEFSCIYIQRAPIAPQDPQTPAHYLAVDPKMPFCAAVADKGYYGRDHGNGQGIPPDGPTRTAYGLYPAGGRFDDDSFQETQESGTLGALGTGIWPIWLSSFTDFTLAEADIVLGVNGDARTYLENGIRKSMAKVVSFADKVNLSHVVFKDLDGNNVTARQAYVPSQQTIDQYVSIVLERYDMAANNDERLNIVLKEYLIALWGNGIEAYNMYRRTGKPDKIQPTIDPAGGSFMRSSYYPRNYVDFNANAEQKTHTDPVFWDTNPPGFVY